MDPQTTDPISWIDLTSAALLLVFLVLGFFRGFLWQMSRLVSLLLAWILANQFHPQVTSFYQDKLGLFEGSDYATYIAFFSIFLGTLILLSVLTMILEKFVEKLHLTFYNRIGGGFLGILQGVGLLMAIVGLIYLITPATSALAKEVSQSRTGRVTRAVVNQLDGFLSEDILRLYGLRPPKLHFDEHGNQIDPAPGQSPAKSSGKSLERSPVPGQASSAASQPSKEDH